MVTTNNKTLLKKLEQGFRARQAEREQEKREKMIARRRRDAQRQTEKRRENGLKAVTFWVPHSEAEHIAGLTRAYLFDLAGADASPDRAKRLSLLRDLAQRHPSPRPRKMTPQIVQDVRSAENVVEHIPTPDLEVKGDPIAISETISAA